MPTNSQSTGNNDRKKGPGKAQRIGISLPEFFKMFPDDEAARIWFEEVSGRKETVLSTLQ